MCKQWPNIINVTEYNQCDVVNLFTVMLESALIVAEVVMEFKTDVILLSVFIFV